ncbi:hypothetical protein BJI49_10520 [Acetobacter pasteurianus]|nr:hypothetical protein BJI49_10520 [Acetobacter pasteurianus]
MAVRRGVRRNNRDARRAWIWHIHARTAMRRGRAFGMAPMPASGVRGGLILRGVWGPAGAKAGRGVKPACRVVLQYI